MEEKTAGVLSRRALAVRFDRPVVGLEAVLVLEGELERFLNTLEVHLVQIFERTRPEEYVEPSIDLREVQRGKTQLENVLTLNVMGSYTDYDTILHPDFPLMTFCVRRFPSGDQLQLTAKFVNFLELLGYFEELLGIIARRHRVVAEVVYVHVSGGRDEPDRSAWQQAAQRLEGTLIDVAQGREQLDLSTSDAVQPTGQASANRALAEARPKPNVFRRVGDNWHIEYAGAKHLLRHMKGLHHISILLSSPGREFHVLELEAAVDGVPPDSYGSTGAAQRAEDGISVWRGEDHEVLDEKALRALGERLMEIPQEMADADTSGDESKVASLQQEYDWIEHEIKAARGLGGRKRTFQTPEEGARIRVKQNIERAIKAIGKHNHVLSDHLTASIETGGSCLYAPESPVN